MAEQSKWQKNGRVVALCMTIAATSLAGSLFDIGCVGKVANNFNPCGTILNCDPAEYDLIMMDTVPDWDLDPTCTIPGMCGDGIFPFDSSGSDTTDSTTTTTTTE